jgi:predicted permease
MRFKRLFHVLPMRMRSLFRRDRVEAELDEEMRYHVDRQIEENIAKGLTPEEARYAALRAMTGIEQRKEECRDTRRVRVIEDLIQDVGYGLRNLRKSPGFAATAVLSLALGIGANTAIFSMVNAVLIRTLPVSRPEQLVLLNAAERDGGISNFAYPDYLQLRDRASMFSGLLAASRAQPVDAGLGAETEPAHAEIVSSNYFSVLGIQAALGRTFTEGDDETPVAVVSDRFWKRSFSEDPSVLGRAITINGAPCTIIGVAPPGFFGASAGEAPDFWVPVAMLRAVRPGPFDLRTARYVDWLRVIGRLQPGVSIEQARTGLNIVVPQIQKEIGIDIERDYFHHVEIESGSRGLSFFRGRFAYPLVVLLAIVAMVLLIACLNVAGMLVARGTTRRREMATRLAIGATRFRLVRQLLTESVLLTVFGGALGLLFASWSTTVLVRMLSGLGPLAMDLAIDARVLAFTAAISIFTGILFGLAPALQAVRRDSAPSLKEAPRTMIGRRRQRMRHALLVGQIALSILLLAGAGLFIRTLRNLKTMDAGFNADGILQVALDPVRDGYAGPMLPGLATRLVERLSAIPGVVAASHAVNSTLANSGSGVTGIEVDGSDPALTKDERVSANWVGPAYFHTLGIPMVAGRDFSDTDIATSPRVAIVNQTLARQFFGEQPAVGRRVRFNGQQLEIIGVARDAKYRELRESTPAMFYFASLQNPVGFHSLEIRTADSPAAVAGAVREAIREVDPRLRILGIGTLADRIDEKLMTEHLVADISGFFSSLTLFLVAIGIYGMLAHAVAQRTNEIGIRTALGARRKGLVWLILRDAAVILAAGLCLGIPAVLAAGQLVSSMLFGLAPSDPATIAFAALVVCATGMIAAYIPARRASRIDPMVALRHE